MDALFRPFRGQQTALSPDGRYLAYTEHTGNDLVINVLDLDRMERLTKIVADEGRPILFSKEREFSRLRFLRWSAGNRLVFAPTIEVVSPPAQPIDSSLLDIFEGETRPVTQTAVASRLLAPVMVVDADGRNPRQLADASDFMTQVELGSPGETSTTVPGAQALIGMEPGPARALTIPPILKGFLGGDRSKLLVEVQGVRNQPTLLLQFDTVTGKARPLNQELLPGPAIYDWKGQPRLARVREQGARDAGYHYKLEGGLTWRRLEFTTNGRKISFVRDADNTFGTLAIPLALDFDGSLIYASNAGRDTFGIYGQDLKAGRATGLALEHPGHDLAIAEGIAPGGRLVFDEKRQRLAGVRVRGPRTTTIWVEGEMAAVQRRLDARFPGRVVEIREWDDARERMLVLVNGGTEPGRLFLYLAARDEMLELFRLAPALAGAAVHETRYFEFDGPGGAPLSGYLTFPRAPRLNPPPLLIWLAPGLPPVPHAEFDPQAQVFADLGMMVCRLNQRGIAGLGAKHRDLLRQDFTAPAADALAAIEWIASHHAVDRKRVATFGEGMAAYHALRATQLHPEAFRCAVVFEPILSLKNLVEPPTGEMAGIGYAQLANAAYFKPLHKGVNSLSLLGAAEKFSVPAFVAFRSTPGNATDLAANADVAELRAQLGRRGLACTTATIMDDFRVGAPGARARLYAQLAEFINLNLYDYEVKIGPARVVK